jgi:hypothetical protein
MNFALYPACNKHDINDNFPDTMRLSVRQTMRKSGSSLGGTCGMTGNQ